MLFEESTASENGVGKINVALILGCALRNIYGPDERLGEVEDEKAGEALLEDEVRLLRMKMDEPTAYFRLRKEVSIPQRMA